MHFYQVSLNIVKSWGGEANLTILRHNVTSHDLSIPLVTLILVYFFAKPLWSNKGLFLRGYKGGAFAYK